MALVGAGGETHDTPLARTVRERVGTWRLLVVAALVAVLLSGVLFWINRPATNAAIAGSTAITAEQLEQDYGVRLDVVGLLAGGGLLELKFQVIDADKALGLFGSVEDMPVLAVEGSDRVLRTPNGMRHSLTILDGASYFFLYANVANSVHEGSQVAFVVNGVRIPHLTVLR